MEGHLCASSGAASGPSSTFNQSRKLAHAGPRVGGGGDELSVPLSPVGGALREEVLRAESGLGLLSGQDSRHIRGRLNLLGNGDNVDGDKLLPSLYELVQFSNSPKTNTRI